MQSITSISELRNEVRLLESEQSMQGQLLKEQFKYVLESLKPANLIKTTFKEVISSPNLLSDILNGALGLTAGFFSKKILVGSTLNPFKNLIGTILEASIATFVATKGDSIRDKITHLVTGVLKKKKLQAVDDE